jgi:hypothetical protein
VKAYLSQNRIDCHCGNFDSRARSSRDSAVLGSAGNDSRVLSCCKRGPVRFDKSGSLVYGPGSLEENSVNISNIRNLLARRT